MAHMVKNVLINGFAQGDTSEATCCASNESPHNGACHCTHGASNGTKSCTYPDACQRLSNSTGRAGNSANRASDLPAILGMGDVY